MNHRNVFGENDHQVSAIVVSSEKRGKVKKGTCTGVERTREVATFRQSLLKRLTVKMYPLF